MSASTPEIARICVRCGRDNDADVERCVDCGFDLTSDLQRDYDRYRAQAPARPEPVTPARRVRPSTRRKKTNPNLRSALKRPAVDTDPGTATPATGSKPSEAPEQTLDLGSAVLQKVLDEPVRSRVATLDMGSGPSMAARTGARKRPLTERPPAPPRPDGGGDAFEPTADAEPTISTFSSATVAWHPNRAVTDPDPEPEPGADQDAFSPTRAIIATGSEDEVQLEPLPSEPLDLDIEPEPLDDEPDIEEADPAAAETRAWKQSSGSAWEGLEDDGEPTQTAASGWDSLGPGYAPADEEHGRAAPAPPNTDGPRTLRGRPGAVTAGTADTEIAVPAIGGTHVEAHPSTGPLRENIRSGTTTYVDATRRGFTRASGGGSRVALYVSIGVGIAVGLIGLGVYIWFTQSA